MKLDDLVEWNDHSEELMGEEIGAVSWRRAPDGTWTGPGAEELGARNLDGMFKDLLAASRSQKKRTK